jgi:chaperonin GroEL
MATFHRKVKSVAKVQVPSGKPLENAVLGTMKIISDLVGSTLGPGGKVVAIERQEFGIPDLVTKDGVTVFRNMGFNDPVAHSIMTLARDASVRTATEAGDGTTTATVLSEAFVRNTFNFCKDNPKVSPQRVVRTIAKVFAETVEGYIKALAMDVTPDILKAVATCSTNGDTELTAAVAKCFELTGDEGNVTITESSGKSGYRVEQMKGYAVNSGYEDSTGRFFTVFVNDAANSRVYLENAYVILHHGTVTDFSALFEVLVEIGKAWEADRTKPHNIVVVATGFSDQVVADLTAPWQNPQALNVFPLIVPRNAMQSGQYDILSDLAAVTGGVIFDPISRPVQRARLEELGPPIQYFESNRYRSNIVGTSDESLIVARVEEIEGAMHTAESEVERSIMNERKAKLSGGLAKLVISAPTSGELREKRDRADDAVCAWRGAAKHGALPGGGWTLLKVRQMLQDNMDKIIDDRFDANIVANVVAPSLLEPVRKLLTNCGYNEEETEEQILTMQGMLNEPEPVIFDALDGTFKIAKTSGVVDSLPAVLEALRNSISIATQLGTLGGVIVFPRDAELERKEASDTYDFYKNAGITS